MTIIWEKETNMNTAEIVKVDLTIALELAARAQGFQIDHEALRNVLIEIEERVESALAILDGAAGPFEDRKST